MELNNRLHPSLVDANNITQQQVDAFYNLMVEIFPHKANIFHETMIAVKIDNLEPKEQFSNLLCCTYDWFHYGN